MERGRGRTEGGAERGEQLGGLLAKLVGDHGQSGVAARAGRVREDDTPLRGSREADQGPADCA